jgi:uncharacterized membrane protein YgdD (TMEM256/DUF423 family)
MAKHLTNDQRGRIAEKIMEWGNLVFAGLVIGKALSGTRFDVVTFLGGILVFAGAYVLAITYLKRGDT